MPRFYSRIFKHHLRPAHIVRRPYTVTALVSPVLTPNRKQRARARRGQR